MGLAALEPWLIELPWCSHTGRSVAGASSTGASVRSATSSVISLCGSQISMSFARRVRPSKRTVPTGPGRVSMEPVDMSTSRTFPPVTLACPAGSPSIEQVVHAVRPRRRADVGHLRSQGVQLDGRGPGAEHQPNARRLGLRHGQLTVGALGARPGGQPVRHNAVVGALQLQRAAQQVRGDGRIDPRCWPGRAAGCVVIAHCPSISVGPLAPGRPRRPGTARAEPDRATGGRDLS